MSSPIFVVVGHVNRGKSSIVSTLAADDSVRIGAMPGTTTVNREYPMRLADETLYTLVDTPGFERPRQTLNWLKQHETSTAERRRTVEHFIETHRGASIFQQECALLDPILRGAAILYVVDGSMPPSPKYEAEMEILRWTSRPRVALINSTSDEDHSAEWRSVLDQYFNTVREFNAHEADFSQRIGLLKMLREMTTTWREPLDKAVQSLIEDRRLSLHESAEAIADALVEMLTLVVEKRLSAEASTRDEEPQLADRYKHKLCALEGECREQLKQIFMHRRLEVSEAALEVVGDDLFDIGQWNQFGLSRAQLTAAGATAGALAGGVIDASVGGASFLIGTLIGGAAGGAASWYGTGKLPQVKVMGLPLGGTLLRIGPMKNIGFPWVVLDRALVFLDIVAQRAHARREEVQLGGDNPYTPSDGEDAPQGIVSKLPKNARREIEKLFSRLRRLPAPAAREQICATLTEQIEDIIVDRHNPE